MGNLIVCGLQQAYPQHSQGVRLKLCRSKLCDFRSYYNWPPLTAKLKLRELVGASPSEAACTSECSCDANMADRWLFILFFFFQNAGEGPTEHVQKGSAADRLYGVSVGTTDQRIVTQKPHRYSTACVPLCYFSRASCPDQPKSATTGCY